MVEPRSALGAVNRETPRAPFVAVLVGLRYGRGRLLPSATNKDTPPRKLTPFPLAVRVYDKFDFGLPLNKWKSEKRLGPVGSVLPPQCVDVCARSLDFSGMLQTHFFHRQMFDL